MHLPVRAGGEIPDRKGCKSPMEGVEIPDEGGLDPRSKGVQIPVEKARISQGFPQEGTPAPRAFSIILVSKGDKSPMVCSSDTTSVS